MSDPITLNFTHNEKEYVAATRWYFAHIYHTRFLLIFSVIVFSSGLVVILLTEELLLGGVVALVAFLLFVRNFYAYFVTPKEYFRRNAKFREEFSLQFSEEGLLFRTKSVESRLEWNFYSRVLETPHAYLLGYDKDMFSLIPKRVFTGDVRESSFRDLLNRKVGAGLDTQNL